MKKIILILSALLLTVLVGYGIWGLFAAPTSPPSTQGGPTPTFPIASSTPTSTVVQTHNFLEDTDVVPDSANAGHYFLGNSFSWSASSTAGAPTYVVEYISQTQYYNIALLSEPIGAARGSMEQYLMRKLRLTEEQMCRLKYMVSVPWTVNPVYSSRNLGFSFCPGATTLPR